ncbi:MAG: threonine dehydratase [Solirubrobacterales bacterium]|nr:threonine dehydratase [Solirubrobacterales bacterium]
MATGATSNAVGVAEIERAAKTIAGHLRATPVLPAREISRRVGVPVGLKAENLQRTGSFKVRGAINKVASLDPDELAGGLIAASAGNHAQAVAVAARSRDASAQVVMPSTAPLAKVEAVRSYGGTVRFVDGGYPEAAALAHEIAEREGMTLIEPFDDPAVIAGQGTVGLEIAEQAPQVAAVVVPIGGGGLAAGVAIAIRARCPDAAVIGVVAERRTAGTICDGIAIKRPGAVTGPLLEAYLDETVSVTDDEVAEAMVLLLERSKLVVEGAGAASVAALLAGRVSPPSSGEICAVLSGGNVDATRLTECIRMGETAAGRRLVFSTVVSDQPGELARLLDEVAATGANVLDVVHIREGVNLHVRETGIRLVLQTDGREHGARVLAAVREQGFAAVPEDAP